MKATITSKGQVTIPREIRQRLRLHAGHVIDFDEKAPFLKAHRVVNEAEARKALGCAKNALPGYTTEKWLSETRGRRVRLRK
jgi:AbrB family looped-hinge helix DNA binding protein